MFEVYLLIKINILSECTYHSALQWPILNAEKEMILNSNIIYLSILK